MRRQRLPHGGGRGLTAAEVAEQVRLQGGVCMICRKIPRRWDIDHDHQCPRCGGVEGCRWCFRGLLCSGCNTALGMMRDSPERLEDAAAYIRLWRSLHPWSTS